jgi:isoquinoline 1-oxidoreductase alpha subunit
MQALALLSDNPQPEESEIVDAMSGNLCRCGTYDRIKTAIRSAANLMASDRGQSNA